MNFIWLKSGSDNLPELPRQWKNVLVVDTRDDAHDRVARGHVGPVVVEVRDSADAAQGVQLATESAGAFAVWIYQPRGTAESTAAFLKAGASRVVTALEEMYALINPSSGEAIAVVDAAAGKSLIGGSDAIRAVAASIDLVANRRCNVLIEGETGTGKEVVAREIHRAGSRARGPWVAVNCGAIPDSLLEAELFGHVKGAFTGALQGRAGKFEAANHGTIFLDEIGDMPFAVQAKLLRVLQEREVERLGGNERIHLDVRVIAATNVNLRERVQAGLFREDLYYRLNVFEITLPPLRERPADLPELARHFVAKACASENLRPKELDSSVIGRLVDHRWPGNVRELENVMELAVILSGSRGSISGSDIRITTGPSRQLSMDPGSAASLPARVSIPFGGLDYQQAIETFEHDLLAQALARTRGNKTAAAELLRLKRTTLSARMRVLEGRMPRLVA